MSTIQNLKNFIRHGKQARVVDPPTTNISPVHAQHQKHQGYGVSEPSAAYQHQQQQHPTEKLIDGTHSVGAVDNRNVAAQAAAAAVQAQGKQQKVQAGGMEAEIQQIVAEEREKQGKLPQYPGLERYRLVAKMGDGAFSNVYRAKDIQQGGEVAIKVVRKFEMNSNQVCPTVGTYALCFPFLCLAPFVTTMKNHPPTLGSDIGRRSPPSGLQKAAQDC
jgi:serine/threonine-protein kinase RCK2